MFTARTVPGIITASKRLETGYRSIDHTIALLNK